MATALKRDCQNVRLQSMAVLDFASVKKQFAQRVTFVPAGKVVEKLEPLYSIGEVDVLQRQTSEGRLLLDREGGLSLRLESDVASVVKHTALGGIPSGLDLLKVADTVEKLNCTSALIERHRSEVPMLNEIAGSVPDFEEIQKKIRSVIDQHGEVAADATPQLTTLRDQIRKTYYRMNEIMSQIIGSLVAAGEVLQDNVISLRQNRPVLQIKAAMRHHVKGVVHGVSNSGSTLFIEPLEVVELCNEWREFSESEEREVRRVLAEVGALVGAGAMQIDQAIEGLAQLDFILARARYASDMRCIRPGAAIATVDSEFQAGEIDLQLVDARHPLLGDTAVPLNISMGFGSSALVITGPNTGGKTVALKTVGLLALMHQSGLQIPVGAGSVMPVYDGIYADLGDQQSIEHSVSTFSSHIVNVIQILSLATPRSLVLLDELGSSTDSEEGVALAKAILETLADRKVSTVVTTHHRSLALYAETYVGMSNASFLLDPVGLRPTYTLTRGVVGRSYAMDVASQLGLHSGIIARARILLSGHHLLLDSYLDKLDGERAQLKASLEKMERAQAELQFRSLSFRQELEYLIEHREDIVKAIQREVGFKSDKIKRELDRIEAALSWILPTEQSRFAAAELSRIRADLATLVEVDTPSATMKGETVSQGDYVLVRELGVAGIVTFQDGAEAEVRIGKMGMRVALSGLVKMDNVVVEEETGEDLSTHSSMDLPAEMDIRGQRSSEALFQLDRFLDKSLVEGFVVVRIIHGKGTGALRRVVREHLSKQAVVKSFQPEMDSVGGDGATIVELV